MLNNKEAKGIVMSVVIMALALAFIRFKTELLVKTQDSEFLPEDIGEVVRIKSGKEKELEEALLRASDAQGNIIKLVVNDVRLGEGNPAKVGDTLVTQYIGSTFDGGRFDSSYERGEPFVFTLGRKTVIQGWEQGLIGMKAGGQRLLVIPSVLGYGNMQVGIIPPNTTLIFAVELLEIR